MGLGEPFWLPTMLWYLLYPLRRTVEAPVLAPANPMRATFTRYGTWAARNVKTVLPVSGAVIFLFLYLFPFLYTTDATNIASGVSHLPLRVWTDAQPLSDQAAVEPDVIMRSVWVHGSYMRALERDVLLGALELQDELLGPTSDFDPRRPASPPEPVDPDADLSREQRDAFHIVNGLTSQSWFFHSPLQYWSGTAAHIAADDDIVSTVNTKKMQPTSANTTLRHSIVFSGKRFEERRLVAADALVITLIHLRDSPVGARWARRAEALARAAQQDGAKWQVIPPDGKSISNRLYEFQFRPMSWPDWVLLTLAYSLAFSYLLLRLSKLRAVKSRLGLMVTILAQITGSIVASFTVCAVFKIDLSRIPYYAYPLVVLAISIENSFRLINAVIVTSSTISISDRIGEAFGATAHVAVANRVQNFLVLVLLSRVTSSGVSAFCTFAAIATVFDFFYLATFFLAVLSVDVRQRELSELEKASLKRTKHPRNGQAGQSWIAAVLRIRLGDTAVSTRIAGTVVLVGFVLIVQAHYAPEGGHQWLNRIFSFSWIRALKDARKPSLLVDIHQARSPTSWLHLQDHETAREVIELVKPWAHSYVARVYDPIVFVLRGADRTPDTREPLFLPAVYDFLHHQVPRFVVTLLTVVAALLLFTNYLVRDQYGDDATSEHPDDEPILSVRTLSNGHSLDVVMLAASAGAQVVSVGLDRTIQIWDVPSGSRRRVLSDPDVPLENPFPVLSLAIDDKSKWLAFVSWQRVFLWDIERQRWGTTRDVDLGGHRPEAVFFATWSPDAPPSLVLVRRNGMGFEMQLETDESRDFAICKTPLVWAVAFAEKGKAQQRAPPLCILTASRKNCIHRVRQHESEWLSTEVKLIGPAARDVHCLLPIPALSMYLIGRSQSVDLVDLDSSTIIHTFQTEMMRPRTLKHICFPRLQRSGLVPLTLCYISAESGDLVVHTYRPNSESDPADSHVSPEQHAGGQSPWDQMTEVRKHVENPGVWEALPGGSIVGVRQKRAISPPSRSITASAASPFGLRRRVGIPPETRDASSAQGWEAWVIDRPDAKDDFETRPLDGQEDEEDELGTTPLMISELGPMTRLGSLSLAVGFGDVVKVISVGNEYFDHEPPGLGLHTDSLISLGSRRKKTSALSGRAPVWRVGG